MGETLEPQETALRNGDDARFRRLMEVLPAAAYTCDAAGHITSFNQRAVELWGRQPALNDPADRYCGSHKLFTAGGAPLARHGCWMALALREDQGYNQKEIVIERPDGSRRIVLANANPLYDEAGRLTGAVNVLVDITEHKTAEEEVRRLNLELEERVSRRTAALEATTQELRQAVEQVKTLRGLVPICSWCKKIRDDLGFWQRLESYLHSHTEAEFTHGICPECADKQYAARPANPRPPGTGS